MYNGSYIANVCFIEHELLLHNMVTPAYVIEVNRSTVGPSEGLERHTYSRDLDDKRKNLSCDNNVAQNVCHIYF